MIKFIVCSDSDIPVADIKKYNIDLLPLIVELDGVEYRAYRDISGEDFRELLKKTKSFPKTATVSSTEMADKMRGHIEDGHEVVMVTMSSKGSGTFNVARLAKEQLEEEYRRELPINIVDSMNFSIAYLHPLYNAVEMAQNGHTCQEIVDYLDAAYKKRQLMFIMTDLEYLKRGGRIKPGAAIIGRVLGVIPILHVNEGMIEPIGKERGMKKTIDSLMNIIEEKCPSKKLGSVRLLQCNRQKEAEMIEDMIKQRFEVKEILPTTSSEASVAAHSGFDLIGITFEIN